jgi:choline dehydrogenase-like flavoprotein
VELLKGKGSAAEHSELSLPTRRHLPGHREVHQAQGYLLRHRRPYRDGHPYRFDQDATALPDIWEGNGYKINPDTNNGAFLGFAVVRTTSADQLDTSPANLEVLVDAQVDRDLFNDKRKAIDVTDIKGRAFKAEKEVVLCARALDRPKILMLSGIGPANQLSEHGIPVIHENEEAGKNLKDHYFITMEFQRAESTS